MSESVNETKKPVIRIVVAVAENGVIGHENGLVWRLPADLKWFKEATVGFPVIMGRKTFESIGRPLPGRRNIVITRDTAYAREGVEVVHSPGEAVSACHGEERVSVIGGGEIYRRFMDSAAELYFTRVHAVFDGDTHFPDPGEEFHAPDEKNKYPFSFMIFRKKGM